MKGKPLEASQHKSLSFDGFTLDVTRGALLRDGVEVRLRPQSFEVLRFLAGNANRLVTKDEIFTAVWGDTVVTDDSLTQCLIDIRRALGDESREVIRTVPRRGYVFELPVQESGGTPGGGAAAAAIAPQLTLRWLVAALAVAAVAMLAWWGVARQAADAPGAAGARANSIAVLAFVDMSEGRDHEYFADGVSEEILNLLTHIPELDVVARTSSFSFKGKDAAIAEIGKALGVAFVLEGSVRRAGNRVRVTAQLVDAATSTHVWSETYDRDLDDLLAVQSEIARSVAGSLKITLAEGVAAATAHAVDSEAYEHYLHGKFLHGRRAPGDLEAAERHLREAVRIDERFGRAWAALAGVLIVQIFEGGLDASTGLAQMGVAVDKALEHDPSSAEVQVRAAHYYFQMGDFARSRLHRERANALDPNHPLVLALNGTLAIAAGDYARTVEYGRRMADRDPLSAVTRGNLANDFMLAGLYDEAARELQRARELSPARPMIRVSEAELLYLRGRQDEALAILEELPPGPDRERLLALVYHALGRTAEADLEVAKLMRRTDLERAQPLAEISAQRGDPDKAFEWLAVAWESAKQVAPSPGMKRYPLRFADASFLRPLHGDPRWQQYLWPPGY